MSRPLDLNAPREYWRLVRRDGMVAHVKFAGGIALHELRALYPSGRYTFEPTLREHRRDASVASADDDEAAT